MKIKIDKKTAEVLQKAIWLTIGTCDKNRINKGREGFKPNHKIMADLGVDFEHLAKLYELSQQINKKMNTDGKDN